MTHKVRLIHKVVPAPQARPDTPAAAIATAAHCTLVRRSLRMNRPSMMFISGLR